MALGHRRSNRLRGYDYTQSGAYFVTICTANRRPILGTVAYDQVLLDPLGVMVQNIWLSTSVRYDTAYLDCFVVMPNHLHGIVFLDHDPEASAEEGQARGPAPTGGGPVSLAKIVSAFKSLSTRTYLEGVRSGRWADVGNSLWQRNYYEHIIRNEDDFLNTQQYIIDNPAMWAQDREGPMAGDGRRPPKLHLGQQVRTPP